MVYKGCTYGLKDGPCYALPTIAIWKRKSDGKQTWTCDEHDGVMDTRLRSRQMRSQYKRTAVKAKVDA